MAPRHHGRTPLSRQRRPSRPAGRPRQEIRPLLFADSDALLRPGGLLEPVAEWAAAFRSTGQELRRTVQAGTLDRGLRQVLSYHVIFHWNRLGLSIRTQSILAWAARTAILHHDSRA
ncbi:thiopeptide-type bacteriocin biosynthesis protein [Streptomyces sp. M10(2022)]